MSERAIRVAQLVVQVAIAALLVVILVKPTASTAEATAAPALGSSSLDPAHVTSEAIESRLTEIEEHNAWMGEELGRICFALQNPGDPTGGGTIVMPTEPLCADPRE